MTSNPNNESNSQKSVLVLSDGKPGHYNQSLGIMSRMSDVTFRVIQVRFRRKWRDNLIRAKTLALAGMKLPKSLIRGLLRWSMESSSAHELLQAGHFDAILSTGSSLAAPNLLLGKLTGSKSVVCMRPSPVGTRHFDLAILPEHMRPRRPARNVVMTLGVPNMISPELVSKAGAELAKEVKTGGHLVIGLLLGGDDKHYSVPPDMVSRLCDVLLDMCEESGAQLALTTSRRTDPGSESVIKSRILTSPVCCFSVIASEPQKGYPVPGIIGLSDVVIVTEDSFAMVCEAASSGRRIVILEVKRKKQGHPKRQRVYEILVERGYIRKASLSNLKSVVLDFARDPSDARILDDAEMAASALRDLINCQKGRT